MNDQTALHAVSTVIGGSANNVRAVHSPSAPSCSRSQTTSVSQRVGRLVGRALTFLDSDSEAVRRCLRNASALLQPEGLNAISNDPAANYTFRAGGLARWRAKWTLTYIEANLGSKITVAELAEGLTLSPSHFSKAFKRSFGLSPMAYVINRRVERAKVLMISSRDQLSEIALTCGFADQSHLCNSFRRIVGVSPALWRRCSQLEPVAAASPAMAFAGSR